MEGVKTVHQAGLVALERPDVHGPYELFNPPQQQQQMQQPVHTHYCMKCKKSSTFMEESRDKTDRGGTRVGGKCTTCGTTMSKFVSGATNGTQG